MVRCYEWNTLSILHPKQKVIIIKDTKYDQEAKYMNPHTVSKTNRFILHDCISFSTRNHYLCKPIPGYNLKTYDLIKTEGVWTCNCQWYLVHKTTCTHLLALYLKFKLQGKIP